MRKQWMDEDIVVSFCGGMEVFNGSLEVGLTLEKGG